MYMYVFYALKATIAHRLDTLMSQVTCNPKSIMQDTMNTMIFDGDHRKHSCWEYVNRKIF